MKDMPITNSCQLRCGSGDASRVQGQMRTGAAPARSRASHVPAVRGSHPPGPPPTLPPAPAPTLPRSLELPQVVEDELEVLLDAVGAGDGDAQDVLDLGGGGGGGTRRDSFESERQGVLRGLPEGATTRSARPLHGSRMHSACARARPDNPTPSCPTWLRPIRMAAPVMKPDTWAWLRKLVTQPAARGSRGRAGEKRGSSERSTLQQHRWAAASGAASMRVAAGMPLRTGTDTSCSNKTAPISAAPPTHPCAASRCRCRSSRPQRQPGQEGEG